MKSWSIMFGKKSPLGSDGISKPKTTDSKHAKMERNLVRKLDCFVMAYCCASYFFNYLDRAAFANAYVSGLKESLNLQGNEYSVLLSMYTTGNVLGQIPHGLIIHKVRPSFWLPFTLIVWSGLTMCSAACSTYAQLCVVRFLQGFMEASLWSGTIYVIGSWYKPLEIAKRTSIFTAVGQIGSMFAGIFMTTMRKTMDGHLGLSGWQWVFLIDGMMGIPIGILGFFAFPDLPESTRAFYLSKEEIQLAISRLPPRVKNSHSIEIKSLCKRLFRYKPLYVLTAFSIISAALEAFAFQNLFLLWMKYNEKLFSPYALTTYPLGVQAVAIVSNMGAGYYIDATDTRLPMGFLAGILQLVTAVMLLIPNLSTGATFFAYYNSGTSYIVNPLTYGWASIITRRDGDDVVRSVTLYTMNLGSQILYTFWGITLYPATDAPYWMKGAITMIVVVFLYSGCILWVRRVDNQSQALRLKIDEERESNNVSTHTASQSMIQLDIPKDQAQITTVRSRQGSCDEEIITYTHNQKN